MLSRRWRFLRRGPLWPVGVGTKRFGCGMWSAVRRRPPSKGHTYWVTSVAFSPDGTTLGQWGCGPYGCVVGCGQRSGEGTLQWHTDGVNSVAFSPDGATLASASDDQTVVCGMWPAVRRSPFSNGIRMGGLQSVAFSLDGAILAGGPGGRQGCVVGCGQRSGEGHPPRHTYRVNSVAFSPDGTTLASGSEDVYGCDVECVGVDGRRPGGIDKVSGDDQGEFLALSWRSPALSRSGTTMGFSPMLWHLRGSGG